jgi:hypothetical protein
MMVRVRGVFMSLNCMLMSCLMIALCVVLSCGMVGLRSVLVMLRCLLV